MNLQENILRIKQIIEQIEPESGKCAITKQYDKMSKECAKDERAWSKELARINKEEAKYNEQQRKMTLDMNFDIFDEKRDKTTRANLYDEFKRYENSLEGQSKYTPEQKFSILYKVFENLKKRPQISYSVRLKEKFNIPDVRQATLDQVLSFAKQMGWDYFIDWYLSGGPKIK